MGNTFHGFSGESSEIEGIQMNFVTFLFLYLWPHELKFWIIVQDYFSLFVLINHETLSGISEHDQTLDMTRDDV